VQYGARAPVVVAHQRERERREKQRLPETVELLRQLTSSGSVRGGESRANNSSGIKALLFAVLEDGVRCYLGPPGGQRTAAEAWVQSKQSSAFSFGTACEVLGFDPDAVRDALARLRQELRQLNRVRDSARADKGMQPTRQG